MPVNPSIALVGIALQEDETTPAEEPQFAHGLTGGSPFQVERSIESVSVACGSRAETDGYVSEINPNSTTTTLGYQEVMGLYALLAMGSIQTEKVGPGLYRHTVTVGDAIPSATVFGQVGQHDALGFAKTDGCKVNELAVEFTGNEPLHLNPSLMGCNLTRLLENPNSKIPPICHGGYFRPTEGKFRLDTAGDAPQDTIITGGSVTISNNCGAVRNAGSATPTRIATGKNQVAVSLDTVPDDYMLYWRMVTGSSEALTPSSKIVYGSYYLEFRHSGNPDWLVSFEGRKVPFTCDLPEVDPEGSTGTFTFSSDSSYVKKVGDSPVTITVVNDVPSYTDFSQSELPPYETEVLDAGIYYGGDVSTFGEYRVTDRGRAIVGTANKVTVPDFNGEGKPQEGLFYAFDLDPREGTEVRKRKSGAWGDWVKADDKPFVALIGEDGEVYVDQIEVKDASGKTRAYEVAVTAAAPAMAAIAAPAAAKSVRAAKAAPKKASE